MNIKGAVAMGLAGVGLWVTDAKAGSPEKDLCLPRMSLVTGDKTSHPSLLTRTSCDPERHALFVTTFNQTVYPPHGDAVGCADTRRGLSGLRLAGLLVAHQAVNASTAKQTNADCVTSPRFEIDDTVVNMLRDALEGKPFDTGALALSIYLGSKNRAPNATHAEINGIMKSIVPPLEATVKKFAVDLNGRAGQGASSDQAIYVLLNADPSTLPGMKNKGSAPAITAILSAARNRFHVVVPGQQALPQKLEPTHAQ